MPNPLLIASLASTGVGALARLFGGSQPDPEAIYRRRMEAVSKYFKNFYGLERQNVLRRGDRNLSIARQLGARQAAARGMAGDVAPFTSPSESAIEQRIADALAGVRSAEAGALASVQSQGLNFPIISKPTTGDYIGSALDATSGVLNTQIGFEMNKDLIAEMNKGWTESLNAVTGTGGQNTIEGLTNRLDAPDFTKGLFTPGISGGSVDPWATLGKGGTVNPYTYMWK